VIVKLRHNSCGCQFDAEAKDGRFYPIIEWDADKLPLDCPLTWKMFADGNTQMGFQLESFLGKSLSKRLQPRNIEELAALISLMRPGCMEAMIGKLSVTQHYIERKHNREPVEYFHPSLEPILKDTYGLLVYQEQAIRIAKEIAGFTLQEADDLRKAAGKKKPEEMAKIKIKFIDGAKKTGIVNDKEAEEIFGWIEKSQRYSFNASHAVSYAIDGYFSIYAKAHFVEQCFSVYLEHSSRKPKPQNEIKLLVNNAKTMGIKVLLPDVRKKNKEFILDKDGITFGLWHIKHVGEKEVDKLLKILNEVDITSLDWTEILVKILANLNKSVVKAIISSGALSFLNKPRNEMLHEYDRFRELSPKESEWLKTFHLKGKTLLHMLELMIYLGQGRTRPIFNQRRFNIVNGMVKSLKNPASNLADTEDWLSGVERSLLGINISCSKVEGKVLENIEPNATCADFFNGREDNLYIVCEIEEIKETVTKKNKERMAFLTVSDNTGQIESVVAFPKVFEEFEDVLFEGNILVIGGKKDKSGSFSLSGAWKIQ
jgi:DNA polymerase-3 subunit alpha